MAKKDKEADDVKPGGEKGGSNKLILILIVVNLLAVAGVGAYLVLFQGAEGTAAAQEPEPEPNEFGPLIEVPTVIVNLSGERWGRFMRVSLHIEAKDVDAQPLIEAALIPIRNRIVICLSELDRERTREPGAKGVIAEEITTEISAILGVLLSTVERRWRFTRAWLASSLSDETLSA